MQLLQMEPLLNPWRWSVSRQWPCAGLKHSSAHAIETTRLSMFAQQVSMKINEKTTEVMMTNVPNYSPVKVNGADLWTTEEFTFLDNTARHDGGAGSDIRNRLNKSRNALRMLNKVWKSFQYSTKTKLRLYQSFVLSPYCTAQNARGWLKAISKLNCLPSTPRTSEESCEYFGPRPSLANIFSPTATKTAWTPSSCTGAGDGSEMWWEESQATSPALHWTPEI